MFSRFLIRLFWSVVTLLGTAVLVFLITNVVPGDVAHIIAGPKATPAVLRDIRHQYHLDDPLWKRLGYYLDQLAHGNLGHSYVTDQPVTQALLTRLPLTASLAATAVVMWLFMAIPLGVLTAKYRGRILDRGALVAATLSLSLPAFWLARMLQYWLGYKAGVFPVAGFTGFGSLLLPGATLALLFVGYYSRLVHTNMVEVLDSPFVRNARAKGLSEARVLFRHALPNALIPVITILGMDVAGLLGGVIFTENVFALPGIGTLAVQSVWNLDVPMIMGTVMLSATMVVTANLVVDILYRWIDPRIKAGY